MKKKDKIHILKRTETGTYFCPECGCEFKISEEQQKTEAGTKVEV